MVAAVLKLVGFDLQRQLARLKAQAEEFKDRTTDEIKHKAIDYGSDDRACVRWPCVCLF